MGEAIKKFGFITILREFWVKTSKQKIKVIRYFGILGNWSRQFWAFFFISSSMQGRFLSFSHSFDKKYITIVFDKVSWYQEYLERSKYGNALQMWHSNKFEPLVNKFLFQFKRFIVDFQKDLHVLEKILCALVLFQVEC